jgi:asparagine synthase (glutamine-hydrolysing)
MEKLSPEYNPLTGFICLCESGSDVNSEPVFQEKIKLELGESVFKVFYSHDCQVSEKNGITTILWGKLFHGLHPDSIPVLYSKYGEDTGSHLSGFYAILILDRLMNRAVIISDRMSSRPMFFAKWDGSWIVSTSFLHLSRCLPFDPVLDISGVAWYLSNGVIHNSHTLFREVKRLERATLYCGNGHSFTAKEYWKFHFIDVPGTRDERTLINKMKEVLSVAVTECLPQNEPVFLSLSGGYDSSGILAVLKYSLKLKDVRTFSYGLNEDKPDTDPYMARKLSELAGYEHLFLSSYNNDFKNAIGLNALWGDGISYFCDEVYAWQQLKSLYKGPRPICLFGDTMFINTSISQLSGETEALESMMIRDIRHLPWLNQYIPMDDFNRLAVELSRDCQILIDKAKNVMSDLQSMTSYFRIEGRARNVLIPWRANFCSKAFVALDPLYHDDCLEFQKTIPLQFRVGKEIFINAVKELAPDFYQSERPRWMGYVPDWKSEIIRNYNMISEEYLEDQDYYLLNAIISPESVRRIIGSEIIHPRSPVKKQFDIPALSKLLFHRKPPEIAPPARKILPAEKFILRYLVLKRTLEIIREMRSMKN